MVERELRQSPSPCDSAVRTLSRMKLRLIVMRHAKSSWESDASSDHARPLNDRGRRDAPRVGNKLLELGWAPDTLLSSDSRRTRETFDGMQTMLPTLKHIEFSPALYHASIEPLREAIQLLPDDAKIVLALGHNPGWEIAVHWLCGATVEMKTATAALLECEAASWMESVAMRGGWDLVDVVRPKEL
jgi:phosphohistidine phosphatase